MMARVLKTLKVCPRHVKPFFPHAAILFLFALLGWSNGYLQDVRPVDSPDLKDTWAMPDWSPYNAGPVRATLTSIDIWDGKKGLDRQLDKQSMQSDQAWRLVGTVRTGKTFAAVVQLGNGPQIQRATPGDILPNGEKILSVGNGYLQFDAGSGQQEIKLFQQEKK
mgnify:CR=1 FL=1